MHTFPSPNINPSHNLHIAGIDKFLKSCGICLTLEVPNDNNILRNTIGIVFTDIRYLVPLTEYLKPKLSKRLTNLSAFGPGFCAIPIVPPFSIHPSEIYHPTNSEISSVFNPKSFSQYIPSQ